MNWCTHLFIQSLVLVIMGMGICNDWNFTITLLILLAELFQFWSLYTLSDWLLNSFAKPPSFCIFSILFLFGITKYCRLILHIPCPSPQISYFPQRLGFMCWGMASAIEMWVLDLLTLPGCHCFQAHCSLPLPMEICNPKWNLFQKVCLMVVFQMNFTNYIILKSISLGTSLEKMHKGGIISETQSVWNLPPTSVCQWQCGEE